MKNVSLEKLKRPYYKRIEDKTVNQIAKEDGLVVKTIIAKLKKEIYAMANIREVLVKKEQEIEIIDKFDGVDIYKTEGAWMKSKERELIKTIL